MSNIIPEGEAVRKAVKWISGQLEESPTASINELVNEAMVRFDLSPREGQFLVNFYRKARHGES